MDSIMDNISEILWVILLVVVVMIVTSANDNTVTYFIEDTDIDPTFKQQASNIINSGNWKSFGYRRNIKEVDDRDDAIINIKLTDRKDMDKWHDIPQYYPSGKEIRFSVTFQGFNSKPRIYIDSLNWLNGVEESGLSLSQYRRYVILHEFAHALGYDHQPCDEKNNVNGVCPVLYQSTRGCPNGFKCGYNLTSFDFTKKLSPRYL